MQLSFADCLLDTDARQLRRGGEAVHLSPKAFELLRVLAEARPRALSKDELYAHLWPDTFVIEANLANLVVEVRAALGDTGRHRRIIRTVHGFGYAFQAEARLEATPSSGRVPCCLVWNERRLALVTGDNTIGRDAGAEVRLDLPSVSRRHARVIVSEAGATIEDLDSKNGTLVQGRRIVSPTSLHDGDEIQLGSLVLTYREWALDKSTETVHEA